MPPRDIVSAGVTKRFPQFTRADWLGAFLAITDGRAVLLGTDTVRGVLRYLVTLQGRTWQAEYRPATACITGIYANGRRCASYRPARRSPRDFRTVDTVDERATVSSC